MQIAGGVAERPAVGRAATAQPTVRTLGSKLNHATTLWDYINRAMPWTNPQSLSADEVYAVTAYVLNLNDIVAGRLRARTRDAADAADAEPQRLDDGARACDASTASPTRKARGA